MRSCSPDYVDGFWPRLSAIRLNNQPGPPFSLYLISILTRVCFVPLLPYLNELVRNWKTGVYNGQRGMAIALLSLISPSKVFSPSYNPLTSHLSLLSSSPSYVTSASSTFHSLCPYSHEMPTSPKSCLKASQDGSLNHSTFLIGSRCCCCCCGQFGWIGVCCVV